jgi:hypothetical protein
LDEWLSINFGLDGPVKLGHRVLPKVSVYNDVICITQVSPNLAKTLDRIRVDPAV